MVKVACGCCARSSRSTHNTFLPSFLASFHSLFLPSSLSLPFFFPQQQQQEQQQQYTTPQGEQQRQQQQQCAVGGAVGVGRVFAVTATGRVLFWQQQQQQQQQRYQNEEKDSEKKGGGGIDEEREGEGMGMQQQKQKQEAEEEEHVVASVELQSAHPNWISRPIPGLGAICVRRLSCGDHFAVLITDRAVAMSFGPWCPVICGVVVL